MRTGTHRNDYRWIVEKIRRGRREEKGRKRGKQRGLCQR